MIPLKPEALSRRLIYQSWWVNLYSAVKWFTEAEVEAMIHAGEIRDGFTLTGFFLNRFL